jgi:hypothetical protein
VLPFSRQRQTRSSESLFQEVCVCRRLIGLRCFSSPRSLPYPPHSGVASRTFNVLKQLQKEFDVSLARILAAGPPGLERDRASAQQSLQQ